MVARINEAKSMAKKPVAPEDGDPKKAKAAKTATCQMPEDLIFWANLILALTPKPHGGKRKSIANLFDPLLRNWLREKVRSLGQDPDEEWEKYKSLSGPQSPE